MRKDLYDYLGPAGFVSILGLAATWAAILFLVKEQPFLAIYAAFGAFFLDSLDGYIARKTNTESDFGELLDIMSDFLNYSFFSALFVVLYIIPGSMGAVLGFLILATGVLRLIRLNVEGFVEKEGRKYYSGIVVCFMSYVVTLLFFVKQLYPEIISWIAPLLIFIFSILQISRIPIRKTGMYPLWFCLVMILLVLTLYIDIWIR